MPFSPDCDCLPPMREFNLPPPPDPSMFMALDRDFSYGCDNDNFNIPFTPQLQHPTYYGYHLSEYLTFAISASLAFVLCVTVAILTLFYCYRKGKCKKMLGKTSNMQMSESSSGSYPVEQSQWSYNSMKFNRNSLKDTDRSLERPPRSNIGVVMYGGIELPSATLEGRIPYSARSFRKSLPPTPTANGPHNCTLPTPISNSYRPTGSDNNSAAEIHYLCSNLPVYEEIPNFTGADNNRPHYHYRNSLTQTEPTRVKQLWTTGNEGLMVIRAPGDTYGVACSPYQSGSQSEESPVSPETTFLAAAIKSGRTLTLGEIQSSLNSPVSHYSSGSNSLQSPKQLDNSQSDESFVRADNISYHDCTNGGRESGYGTEGCNLGLWDSPRSNKKIFLSPQLSANKKLPNIPGGTQMGPMASSKAVRTNSQELTCGRHPKSVVHFVDANELDNSAYV